jgi:hypothetical protein
MDVYLAFPTGDTLSQLQVQTQELEVCSGCERRFSGSGPLNYHRRSCRKTRHQLQGVLAKAKELWEAKKRSRVHLLAEGQAGDSANTPEPYTQTPGLTSTSDAPTLSNSESNSTINGRSEAGSLVLSAGPSGLYGQAISLGADIVCAYGHSVGLFAELTVAGCEPHAGRYP